MTPLGIANSGLIISILTVLFSFIILSIYHIKKDNDKKRLVAKYLLLLNCIPIYWIINYLIFFPHVNYYVYISSDNGWKGIEIPEKGHNLEGVLMSFENYKESKKLSSIKMFRTFKKDWTKPWCWVDNVTNERWAIERKEF